MEVARRLLVGVDLGATNCRVTVQPVDGSAPPLRIAKFECHSTSSLMKSLTALEKSIEPHGVAVASCVAAAGPITDSTRSVVITNWPEGDQQVLLSALPQKLFPRDSSRLANDMEAGAIGLVALQTQGKLAGSFKRLWGAANSPAPSLVEGGAQNLVLAVGTGLGNAALSFHAPRAIVTPLEGGHSAMIPCAPLSADAEKERALFAFLSRRVWQGKHAPEWEDVLSGRGIGFIYDWLTQSAQVDHTTSAELSTVQIVDMARTQGCAESLQAVATHYKMLARFSQVFTISIQAKAVFWMGDNLVANLDLVDKISEQLKSEFLACSKPQWVERCPIYVQTKKENFNTLGALYLAKSMLPVSTM